MKKLMIAFATIAVAIVANAAAVEWSMTAITASPDSAAAAGWVGYVMDASTYDAFSALSADQIASYVDANYLYTGQTKSARGSIALTIKDGNFAGDETVSSYMVLFNNADASAATYYASTALGSTTIPSGGADASIKFGTFTTAMSAAGSSGGWTSTAAVPEPTSGLLMLLGMAGLALKRKRA